MSRPITTEPTETHIKVLRTIATMIKNGCLPTIAELCATLSLKGASSINRTLSLMQRLGLIEYDGGGKRGKRKVVKLTSAGKTASGQLGIPLLGAINAGPLEEALAQPEARVEIHELLPHKEDDFLLNVNGDSMKDDGILHGDKVLISPTPDLRNGEIAAVYVGESYQVTLKRVFIDKARQLITFRASNPDYPEKTFSDCDVRVAGVFRGLIRTSTNKGISTYGI